LENDFKESYLSLPLDGCIQVEELTENKLSMPTHFVILHQYDKSI